MAIDINHVRFTLPRHNAASFKPVEEILMNWEAKHGSRFTNEDLRAHAQSSVHHNICHEFGDVRARHMERRSLQWAECILIFRETGECWAPDRLWMRRSSN